MSRSKVKLVWITSEAEKIMGYCARVSNPKNQDNPDVSKLLAYCISHKHWSVFETASLCVEVKTDRAIARQILRHKSFSFQEHSQRYAEVQDEPIYIEARRQDTKNRQNSIDDLSQEDKEWFLNAQKEIWELTQQKYKEALEKGIAKECARAVLPEGITPSTMYVSGTVRSWIHFLDLRKGNGTQLEHREIAELIIKEIFKQNLPEISKALGWLDGKDS